MRLRAVRKWPPLPAIEGGPPNLQLQPGDEALLLFYKDEGGWLLREVRSAVFALSLKDKVSPLATRKAPRSARAFKSSRLP